MAYLDAILGAEYKVETIRGSAWLSIPPGTQHGATLQLPGAGVEQSKDSFGKEAQLQLSPRRGSHYYKIAVRVPVEVDAGERELLQQLKSFRSE